MRSGKCAQTVGSIRPYSVWCSTDPSVIRGSKITDLLYHGAKKASRKQINNYQPISKPFHVKDDKTDRMRLQKCKNTGGSDNRPNIFSISQPGKEVNIEFVENYKIYDLQKRKLFILYNIPSCVFSKPWYYKHTKR